MGISIARALIGLGTLSAGVTLGYTISELTIRDRRGDFAPLAQVSLVTTLVAQVAVIAFGNFGLYIAGAMVGAELCVSLIQGCLGIAGIGAVMFTLLALDKRSGCQLLDAWNSLH